MSKKHQVKEIDMKKNAEVGEADTDEMKVVKLKRAEKRQKSLLKLPDAVAQDDLCLGNEPIPFGKELFPQFWHMQYCDLYYPNAKGGGIYMDMPKAPYEIDDCEKKFQAYRKKGVRYTFAAPSEDALQVAAKLDPAWSPPKVETPVESEARANKISGEARA